MPGENPVKPTKQGLDSLLNSASGSLCKASNPTN